MTVLLYIEIPKGFFPLQDTGLIQGISEAGQAISFDAMSQKQQALADVIRKDPDVRSLSSFIGVDGSNVTLNSGRFLIDLKPIGERTTSVTAVIARIERAVAAVQGVALYLQPVQDLTIDSKRQPRAISFRTGRCQRRGDAKHRAEAPRTVAAGT